MKKGLNQQVDIFEPIKIGVHTVPGIWAYMLPASVFNLKIPDERNSTCLNCPRIVTDKYREDYRCCTYHPRIPNFLLGMAWLAEDGSKAEFLKGVAQKNWFLPEGMQATPQQWANLLADVAEERFGSSKNVLCPMLDTETGYCNIYAFRNSVCSTFFCLNNHGQKGHDFWAEIASLVGQVEMALAQWALDQCGFDIGAYIKRLNALAKNIHELAKKDQHWKKDILEKLWGVPLSEIPDIYKDCAQHVIKEKSSLWQIANEWTIVESTTYEKATHDVVPEEYQDQIEDTYEDDEVAMTPQEILSDVIKLHTKLFKLPETDILLNPHVEIEPNPLENEEDNHFAKKPFVLKIMKKKKPEKYSYREFITAREKKALEFFKTAKPPIRSTFEHIEKTLGSNAEDFLTEWNKKKVLKNAKYAD